MPAFANFSGRHRRLLAEMGIDLWVRRAPVEAALSVVAEPSGVQPSITVSIDTTPHAAPVELECLAAPGAVVIGAFASVADRRFAQDVVLAVTGVGAKVIRTQFRWPQTQTADRSPSTARSAFAGFLQGQTERANARCVMLLGDTTTALLEPAFSLEGCDVLSLPDAAQLRGDAARKKTLWLTISPLVRH